MRALLSRLLTPTGFALAGLCFLLPFATVSCDTPGGYGHAAAGGTSTYTGLDLAVGGSPAVSPADRELPAEQWRPDRLPPRPAALAALALLVVAVPVGVVLHGRRVRFPVAAAMAATALALVLINQADVESRLRDRVVDQLPGGLPTGKSAGDFVHTGGGFGVFLLAAGVLTAANLIGWARRPTPARATPIPFRSRREMRARGEAAAAARAAATAPPTSAPGPTPPPAAAAGRAGDAAPVPPTVPLLGVDPHDEPTEAHHHHRPAGTDPWPGAPV